MRVLYLCPDLGIPVDGHKGASAHVRAVVAALRAEGCEVSVLSPVPATGGVLPIREPGLHRGLAKGGDRRVGSALRHIWANAGVERALEEQVAAGRPDLIYERYSPFGLAGGVVARRHAIPHILEVNSPLAREGAEFRGQALSEAALEIERSALATAGAVVAVSAELKRELVEDGAEADRIRVLPNGVDTALFAGAEPAPRPDGRLAFGFVGGLRPWHGIGDMAAAFDRVAEELDARLLVIGDGPERGRLDDLRARHPDRVTVTGALPQARVPALLRSVDVALAPYPAMERFYFSPLKVLEYMAAGRAIIGSRIGQVAELIEDGLTGLLVPPGEVEALAATMRRLGTDAALRAELGRRAAEVARDQHDWSQRAREILRIARALDPHG